MEGRIGLLPERFDVHRVHVATYKSRKQVHIYILWGSSIYDVATRNSQDRVEPQTVSASLAFYPFWVIGSGFLDLGNCLRSVFESVYLGRPLGYLISSLRAFIRDPIYCGRTKVRHTVSS